MDIECAEILVEHSYDELTLHENYSGRGMYGNTTAGVSGSISDLFTAIASVMRDGSHEEREVVAEGIRGGTRTDSMGLGTIFY